MKRLASVVKVPVYVVVAGLYFVFQTIITCASINGLFLDEAIYVASGLRVFQGKGWDDQYTTWFTGTPFIWSPLAAAGYFIGGVIGTRMVSVILSSFCLLFFGSFVKKTFGENESLFAVLFLSLNGLNLALGHFAVYDVLAECLLAVCLWALATYNEKNDRLYLGVVAVAFAIGVITKYPFAFLVPVILSLLFILRRKKGFLELVFDYGTLFLIWALMFSAYFMAFRVQLLGFMKYNAEQRLLSTESTTGGIVMFMAYALALPTLLALCAFLVPAQKTEKLILFVGSLILPANHILTHFGQSENKHVVWSLLLLSPLIGVTVATVWKRNWLKSAVAVLYFVLVFWGANQMANQDLAWKDPRPAQSYLESHLQVGEKVLADDSWDFIVPLLSKQLITEPWSVADQFRVTNEKLDPCMFQWFVATEAVGGYSFAHKRADECHAIEVFRTTGKVKAFNDNGTWFDYDVSFIIYRTGERRQ